MRGRMSEIIKVGLGERSYDIHVGHGLLFEAGTLFKPLARGPVPVVTDATVGEIHLADISGMPAARPESMRGRW